MFENRRIIEHQNSMIYHIILFISFFAAFKLHPIVTDFVIQRLANQYVQYILPFIVTYVLAIYLLPEVGFIVYKSATNQ